MAIRQYIGARYVPKPDGTFDSTKSYEPLTIVDDGNGNSYTSKIPVPAGSSLNDHRYWAQTGNFSGAVQQLQTRMTAAEGQIASLNNRVSKTENDILRINRPKTFLICDSYGNRVNSSGKTIIDIMLESGIDGEGYSVGGAGFASATKFVDILSQYTGDKTEVNRIVVIGGANDNNVTVAQIKAAIESFCETARTQFPNARIYIVPCGVAMNNEAWSKDVLRNMPEAYINGGIASKCIVADNAQYILRNTQLLEADGIHPNNSGVDALADQIIAFLKGGTINVEYNLTANVTYASGITAVGDLIPIKMHRKNGVVTLQGMAANGFLGVLQLANVTENYTVNVDPAFTLSDTLISSPTSVNDDYISFMGQCYSPSTLKWDGGFGRMKIYGKTGRFFLGSFNSDTRFTRFHNIDTTVTVMD